MKELIKRNLKMEVAQIREAEDGTRTIVGVIPFNSRSEDMGFYEYIAPTAFNKTLADGADVKVLYNHDDSKLLGRTKNGSARLSVEEDGLHVECDLLPTSFANDAYEQIRTGLNTGLSFGFYIIKQDITTEEIDGENMEVHTLREVRLFEVSFCVTFPAYPETDAKARSLGSIYNDLETLSVDDLKALEEKVEEILKTKEPQTDEPNSVAVQNTTDTGADALKKLKEALTAIML